MINQPIKNYKHHIDANSQVHLEQFRKLENTLPDQHIHSYLQYPSANPNQKAQVDKLNELIMSGMKPKWYCVIHLNDGGNSKRQHTRRLDIDEVTNDLWQVKNFLYTELYSRRWQKLNRRARSIFGIEYGNSKLKPHINLIIEELPYPYDTFRSFYILLDRYLPDRVRCIWRQSAHIQPIDDFNVVTSYITKESDFRNSTIIPSLTDYQIK
tara:strand:+ start:4055 stop:4687 length:633 start_codon:yes stop_codon:yes gene_type:complete